MAFLEFSNISKGYPGVQALANVSFTVEKGAVHGLMGENGAGKSTLIRVLSGDQAADGGNILIDGEEQRYGSVRDAFHAGVIVIHQELQLVPELTVAENLWLGRFPAKGGIIHSKRLIETVRSKLEEIGIDVDPSAKVASLSIGARQMVEIAKAVMLDARVIALDEPTSSLSSRESEILFSLIDRLKAKGTVILYVSHRLDEIFRLCDSLTVLRDGKLAAHHPQIAETTREQIISEMVGREISNVWGWRERALSDVRLEIKGLSGSRLPNPISFSVRQGEILGFFGLIGAGRSEMARLLYGADTRHQGQVTIDGIAVSPNNPKAAINAGMVLCPEDRKFDGIVQGRSIEENIAISSRRHFSPFGILSPRQEAALADRFIAKLRVRTPSRKQDIINLSGGNQQKVILGRWLSEQGIKVLVIDEPTRGIDVGAKSEIYEILYELAAGGMAIVVISSELPRSHGHFRSHHGDVPGQGGGQCRSSGFRRAQHPDGSASRQERRRHPLEPGIRTMNSLKKILLGEQGLVVIFTAAFVIVSLFVPNFLTERNMLGLLQSVVTIGIVACTMMFCLASRDFDLSVGSIVAFSGMIAVMVSNATGSIPVGLLAALLCGAVVGFVNGIVIARFRINALITTLATMQIVRGLALIASDGRAVGINDPDFYQLALSRFLTVPTPIWIMLILFILFGFVLNRTVFGKNTLAIGGNPEASRLAGVNVVNMRIWIFALQGLVCGIAGILLASRITSGQPNAATGLELSVISACVLGGVSLAGGRAAMSGVIVGVLIMGIAENVMNLLNIQAFYQYVVRGLILLIAVLLDNLRSSAAGRRG
ncbi:ABC-type sugar transport system ATPase subunit/ribose/xylose/arabinose/galactoside ABC-type transport system permease subunit [Rhizobium beringeri]